MRLACAPTTAAAVKFVNMATDWCTVFKVFDILLLSFLHKNTSEDLKVLKELKRGMEGKNFLYFTNILLFVWGFCS